MHADLPCANRAAANERARYRCVYRKESVPTPSLCLQLPMPLAFVGRRNARGAQPYVAVAARVSSVGLCGVLARAATQPVLSLSRGDGRFPHEDERDEIPDCRPADAERLLEPASRRSGSGPAWGNR